MRECKCTFAQKMQGNGCDICNPAEALEIAKERITDLEAALETQHSANRQQRLSAKEVIDSLEAENANLRAEVERLKGAIKQTIEENLHLADGEVCTLIHIKRALEVEE